MVTTEQATADLFTLATHLPFRIAPERGAALVAEVFGPSGLEIRPSRVEAFFSSIVEDRAIYLSFAGLASLWSLSYAAFHTIDVATRLAADPNVTADSVDLGELWAVMRLRDHVDYARRLFRADEDWPTGLAQPDAQAVLETDEGRVNNLFFGALSWIMLHEIGHVHRDHSRLLGRDMKLTQEWEADHFATCWILDEAEGLEREFRALAIIVAMAWELLFEEARHGGDDHPPSILRFQDAASWFELGEDSYALESGVYLLKAIFDPATIMPAGLSARQAFDWMEARLIELFPRP